MGQVLTAHGLAMQPQCSLALSEALQPPVATITRWSLSTADFHPRRRTLPPSSGLAGCPAGLGRFATMASIARCLSP